MKKLFTLLAVALLCANMHVSAATDEPVYGYDFISGCDVVFFKGMAYTTDAIVYDTIVGGAANGNDSIVTVYIQVNQPSISYPIVLSGCDVVTYMGREYTSTGLWYDTIVWGSVTGCDSIVPLYITVYSPSFGFEEITGNDAVTYKGITYTSDALVYDTIWCGALTGCDSIVAVNIIVSHTDPPAPCLIASGTCGDNLTWQLSCDSVLTISGTGAMTDYNVNNTPWDSYRDAIKSIIIGNGVTSIGVGAFENCSGLTSVTIPNSVTSIGDYAFYFCTGLTSINVESENPNYSSEDGVLFNKDKTVLIQCPEAKNGVYTIPNSVTSIGDYAFHGCIGLTSVTIPNSVTSIGDVAFAGCSGLTSVTIPNSVTSIGSSAFSGCTGLTSVTIPNSVTSIEYGAFSYCTGLTSVTIPNSVTSIGEWAFYYCSGLTSLTCEAVTPPSLGSDVFYIMDTLYVPAESLAAYQAADGWKDFLNILPIEEEPIETVEADYNVAYKGHSDNELSRELITLHVPVPPVIEGFTFLKWQVVAGDLQDGIYLQAVYTADEASAAPAVYTNPANPAQKLIRDGNVYILKDGKQYTVTGQRVQ